VSHFQRRARPFARGVGLRRFHDLLLVRVDRRFQAFRNLARQRRFERAALVRRRQTLVPGLAMARALRADLAPLLQDFFRDHERLVRPVEALRMPAISSAP
jgi:hypothetical protein